MHVLNPIKLEIHQSYKNHSLYLYTYLQNKKAQEMAGIETRTKREIFPELYIFHVPQTSV